MLNIVITLSTIGLFAVCASLEAGTPASSTTARYIQSLAGIYKTPGTSGGSFNSDAPFTGNGSMRVVLLGTKESQTFHISHANLWTDYGPPGSRPVAFGGLTISAPPLPSGQASATDFLQEQRLWNAELHAAATTNFSTRTITCATENTVLVELQTESATPIPITISLWSTNDNPHLPAQAGVRGNGGIAWVARDTGTDMDKVRWIDRAVMAAKLIGADLQFMTEGNGKTSGTFPLSRGHKVFIVVTAEHVRNAAAPVDPACARAQAVTLSKISELYAAHVRWWHAYWNKSWLRTYDATWDQAYFGLLYLMACVNRPGADPAGQYPLCVTDNHGWNGDYHMNQEYLGQYCWGFSGNRPEVVDNVFQPMLDFVPTAKVMAQTRMQEIAGHLGPRKGVLFPCGIVPHGFCPIYARYDNKNGVFIRQVTNAAYNGMLFIWNYEYYQDREWLRKTGYPFLRLVGDFWESHLIEEDHRLVSYGSAWENGYGKNPITDLAFARRVLTALITFSKDLGVDTDKRPHWQNIVDRLSELPTYEADGKRVFSAWEGSQAWHPYCILEAPLFPSEVIGLDSSEKMRQTALNTFDQVKRGWRCPKLGIFGARIGYPADDLFELVMSECLTGKKDAWMGMRRNLTIGDFHGSGELLEFLQSSMLQSADGEIRFFPTRRTGKPASFHNLRAKGAFLVTAELKDGVVCGVRITSEKGRDLTVVNPWPGKKARVVRNERTGKTELATGDRFTLKTASNETLELKPE